MTSPKVIAFFETTLASSISSTATSFTLTSALDKEGVALATDTYGFVIDEGSSNEEIVIATCTGVTCTSVKRGVSVSDGDTEVTVLKKTHRRGASVKITDAPLLMLVATRAYVDGVAVAGAPDAALAVKGIVELATAAEIDAGTATGSTGAGLAVAPDQLELSKYAVLLGSLTGVILPYGSATAPTGFLLCDGSAVSRTTYATLFAITSTSYGVGDGTTTFNVPDLQGRFPLGYSASAPTKVFTFASRASDVITVTGADNHAHNELQTGQAVLYTAASGAMTGLTHNTTYYVIRVSATTFSLATSVALANAGTAIALSSDGTGAQTFTATYTARPMGQAGGEETHALTDAQMPSHIHNQRYTGNAGGFSIGSAGDGSWTPVITDRGIQPAGSDTPHNIMPLFTVVNYIIKT